MNHYLTTFALHKDHRWDVATLEAMMPFERDIYVALTNNAAKEQA